MDIAGESEVQGSTRSTARVFMTPEKSGVDELALRGLAKARSYLAAGDTVLVCGPTAGHIAIRLAADVKSVHGVDTSASAIAAARQRAEQRRISNASFAHSSVFDEAYEPESYEVVLAFGFFHLLEDPQRAVYRMAELLRPGGLLISSTPCLGERQKWARSDSRTAGWLLRRLGKARYLGVYTVRGLLETHAAAGLLAVEAEELERGSTVHLVVARKPVVSPLE